MTNFSTTKMRIIKFIENERISKHKFYTNTGLANGTLDKKSGLTVDSLEKIISKYPELNIDWLLTGEGDMLRKNTQKGDYNTNIQGDSNKIEQTNKELMDIIKEKDKQIDKLLDLLNK